jgi:hypothetical protein
LPNAFQIVGIPPVVVRLECREPFVSIKHQPAIQRAESALGPVGFKGVPGTEKRLVAPFAPPFDMLCPATTVSGTARSRAEPLSHGVALFGDEGLAARLADVDSISSWLPPVLFESEVMSVGKPGTLVLDLRSASTHTERLVHVDSVLK